MANRANNLPSETELLVPAIRGMLRLGWVSQMTMAAAELPWYQKRIDVAWLNRHGSPMSLELKVSSWKRAIQQAYVNRWVVEESWVGLWHTCVSENALQVAAKAGVGVLVITNNTAYPVLPPDAHRPMAPSDTLVSLLTERNTRMRDLLSAQLSR